MCLKNIKFAQNAYGRRRVAPIRICCVYITTLHVHRRSNIFRVSSAQDTQDLQVQCDRPSATVLYAAKPAKYFEYSSANSMGYIRLLCVALLLLLQVGVASTQPGDFSSPEDDLLQSIHKSGCASGNPLDLQAMACTQEGLQEFIDACNSIAGSRAGGTAGSLDHSWGTGLIAVLELCQASLSHTPMPPAAFDEPDAEAQPTEPRHDSAAVPTAAAEAATAADCKATPVSTATGTAGHRSSSRASLPSLQLVGSQEKLARLITSDSSDWALPAFLGLSYRYGLHDDQYWAGKNGSYARSPSSAPKELGEAAKYLSLASQRLAQDFANQGKFALSAPHAQLINRQTMTQIFVEGGMMLQFVGDWHAWDAMNTLGAEVGVYPSRWQRPTMQHIEGLRARPIWTGAAFQAATKILEDTGNFADIKGESMAAMAAFFASKDPAAIHDEARVAASRLWQTEDRGLHHAVTWHELALFVRRLFFAPFFFCLFFCALFVRRLCR